MVSEVVTNAVRHARPAPWPCGWSAADALLCEVDDDDHELPTLLSAGPGDEFGRGLRVVSTLAREWGASRTAHGKSVWFELSLPRALSTDGRGADAPGRGRATRVGSRTRVKECASACQRATAGAINRTRPSLTADRPCILGSWA